MLQNQNAANQSVIGTDPVWGQVYLLRESSSDISKCFKIKIIQTNLLEGLILSLVKVNVLGHNTSDISKCKILQTNLLEALVQSRVKSMCLVKVLQIL